MATTTLAEIKDKLQRMETELHEVLSAVQELEAATPVGQHTNGHTALEAATAEKTAPEPSPLTSTPVDKVALRAAVDELFAQMGIADVEPIGAEKLQEMMRQEGIKAEGNIFSRGIIAMREE